MRALEKSLTKRRFIANCSTLETPVSDTQITRIPIFPFGMVNAYLIRGEAGCILVDTGIPGSEKKVDRVLKRHGLKFRDIKLIVVTHAHTDHAGAAARLRSLSGAPILAHYADVDFFTRKREMTLCPTGPFGRFFIKTPLPHQPYEAFEPDILMRDGETTGLLDFGINGTVRHVGGHTPGSIAIELASQEALVGDLVSSGILLGGIARKQHAIRPPFEDDPHSVADELQRLVHQGVNRFYMGHGGPLLAPEVLRHSRRLAALPKTLCAACCSHPSHA